MSIPVGPVVYSIVVNGVVTKDLPLDVRLEQTWGNHDLFTLRIEYNRLYPMASIKPWPDNAMVQIVWGRRPNSLQVWYGYVNHHSLKGNASSGTHNLQYTYFCVGTSKPMNAESSRMWGKVTPTYIAKQIAAKHHLRCVVTSTTQLLPHEAQANQSDFAFLQYIADKSGYRVWVSGGTLYFIDPAVLLSGSARQAVPTFRQDKLLTRQDTMRDFDLLKGDNLPGSVVANRQVFGIDSSSGHLFSASAGTGIAKVNTVRVAQNWGDANRILSAWQGLSQFWQGATAELFGNTLLYPGKVVYLDGNALPGGNIGYWIVVSAEHILLSSGTSNPSNDKYVTRVILMRNTDGPIPVLKGSVTVSPEFVPCVASNGVWFSSSQQVILDGQVNG